ncbi:minor capsid protein [Thermogutta sp.]|uniref:minor capsid protein n=1 Tax=Thermogutta sp. TaxID=1962930 RepID=UPI00321FDBB2
MSQDPVLLQVARLLADRKLVKLVEKGSGGDCFLGWLPDEPDNVVCLRAVGGETAPSGQPYDYPTIQIVVRDRDGREALRRTTTIYNHLHGLSRLTLGPNGNYCVSIVARQSGPVGLGLDAKGRHEYSLNYDLFIINDERGG